MIYGNKLKSLIYSKGHTLKSINDELNRLNGTSKSVQNLSNKINHESLKYTELLQILHIIGYDCRWVSIDFDEDKAKKHISELYRMFNCEIAENFGIFKR